MRRTIVRPLLTAAPSPTCDWRGCAAPPASIVMQWDEETRQEVGHRRYLCGDHAATVRAMVEEVEPPRREPDH